MAAIWKAICSPLGKKILAGLAVVAVVAGLGLRVYEAGKRAGKSQADNEAQQQIEDARAVAHADAQARIAAANTSIAEAQVKQKAAEAQSANYERVIATLSVQIGAAHQAVAGMPAEQLEPYTAQQLAARGITDPVAQRRAIADAVTVVPKLEQQVTQQAADITALKADSQAKKDELAGRDVREQAERDDYNSLQTAYVELWNLRPLRKRGGKCLWIWKCADKKLALPSPAELAGKRKAAK